MGSEPQHLNVLLTWGKLLPGVVRHAREVVERAHRGVLACKRDAQDTPPARDPLGETDARRAAWLTQVSPEPMGDKDRIV